VTITYDFRDAKEVLVSADLVCAECDRVWHRARVPDLTRHKNVQRHRLTLLLPPKEAARTWIARGKVHREGDDAQVVYDATYGQLMLANEEWRKRHDSHQLAAWRRKQREQAKKDAALADWQAWYAEHKADLDARDVAWKELGLG
jgi:hypothetical protein